MYQQTRDLSLGDGICSKSNQESQSITFWVKHQLQFLSTNEPAPSTLEELMLDDLVSARRSAEWEWDCFNVYGLV